jgi:hypothetical protein
LALITATSGSSGPAASREITTALRSGADSHLGALRLIAERTIELTEAEQTIVLVPTDLDGSDDDIDTGVDP